MLLKQSRGSPQPRQRKKCPHGKQSSLCNQPGCSGVGLCKKHGKEKHRCKDPACGGGGSLCAHGKQRTYCNDPACGGGGALCAHGKPRSLCNEPACGGGGGLCAHGIVRSDCKVPECGGGGSLCAHGKRRSKCKDPACGGGGAFCAHGKLRTRCKDPACGGGGSFCVHGKERSKCKDPACGGGGSLCAHGKLRFRCKDPACGGGGEFCAHGIVRRYCKPCGGTYVCINGECTTSTKKASTMCRTCCPQPHRNTRCKEIAMAWTLKRWAANRALPIYTVWGRQNPEAEPVQCDRMLPDFTWELDAEQRVVVLEFDEKAHRSYEVRCEFARALKLAVGFKRPLHLIRYNCDELPRATPLPPKEEREALLLARLQAALAPATDGSRFARVVIIEFLYYYDIPGSAASAPFLQTLAFATYDACEAWAAAAINKLEALSCRPTTRADADVDVMIQRRRHDAGTAAAARAPT